MPLEKCADACGIPANNILQDRNQDTEGIVAQDGSLRDLIDVFVIGNSDGKTVKPVHVHHHMHVGTAIADIDEAIVTDSLGGTQIVENGDFTVPGRHPNYGLNFAGLGIVLELRSENVILRYDTR